MSGKVGVVGSYNTGFVVYVKRLPIEGETLKGHGFRIEHGGKGSNQAIQAARLGCQTFIIARVGADIFGERALNKWRAEKIDTTHVVVDRENPTGAGLVIVGPAGKNMIIVDLGANMHLTKTDVSNAAARIRSADVVLTQLEIPFETSLHALRTAEGMKILNPAPAQPTPPETLKGINIITPNEVEMAAMAGYTPGEDADLENAAKKYAKYVDNVVVTLGERGAMVVDKNDVKHVKAPRVNAVDSTGAGDAFNGALATALARGYTVLEAVEYACHAGAFLAARIRGGELVEALPEERELEKFISEHRV
ncbi:ribokinase [Candidatus Caldarchaeum subterraneum]|uniref:Ribokinase n=1 Tax=Caldiarchaeum subterraneum TaxID=311458 RepID=E6N6J4_CALS0|nr:ribokinase [Candidatus Caldarchaeum subterraneum]BAJ50740.1 ribokinase [Candidatus Caldarchaeum subterraneum]